MKKNSRHIHLKITFTLHSTFATIATPKVDHSSICEAGSLSYFVNHTTVIITALAIFPFIIGKSCFWWAKWMFLSREFQLRVVISLPSAGLTRSAGDVLSFSEHITCNHRRTEFLTIKRNSLTTFGIQFHSYASTGCFVVFSGLSYLGHFINYILINYDKLTNL